MVVATNIEANIEAVNKRIISACERVARSPQEVALIAVTKTIDISAIVTAFKLGIGHFGENRVQEAVAKIGQLSGLEPRPTWHMVGRLQTNKAKVAVEIFDTIDSVDSVRLAEVLSRRTNKSLPILLEVNITGEASKTGFSVAEVVKTKAFWMLYLICIFAFGAEQLVIVHIVPYSGAIGVSPAQASLGLSFLGISMVISRVSTGALSDRIGRVPTLVVCCGIEAAAIFLLLVVNNPAMLYPTMVLLGFGYGGWAVSSTAMLGDYFGLKNIGAITGIWFTCGAPAAVLGPLMGGIIFDSTGSYFMAIVIAGLVCIAAVVLAVLIRPPQKPLHLELARIE